MLEVQAPLQAGDSWLRVWRKIQKRACMLYRSSLSSLPLSEHFQDCPPPFPTGLWRKGLPAWGLTETSWGSVHSWFSTRWGPWSLQLHTWLWRLLGKCFQSGERSPYLGTDHRQKWEKPLEIWFHVSSFISKCDKGWERCFVTETLRIWNRNTNEISHTVAVKICSRNHFSWLCHWITFDGKDEKNPLA